MSKVRIYDLANEMGVKPKDLFERIKELGYDVRSHSSTLSEEEAQAVKDRLEAEGWPGKEAKREEASAEGKTPSKPAVIIRRRRESEEGQDEEKAEEKSEEERAAGEKKPKVKKIKLVIKRPVKKQDSAQEAQKETEPEKVSAQAPEEKPEETKPAEAVKTEAPKAEAPEEKAEEKPEEKEKEAKVSEKAEKGPVAPPKKEEPPKKEAAEKTPSETKPRGPRVVARAVGVAKQVVEMRGRGKRPPGPRSPAAWSRISSADRGPPSLPSRLSRRRPVRTRERRRDRS